MRKKYSEKYSKKCSNKKVLREVLKKGLRGVPRDAANGALILLSTDLPLRFNHPLISVGD